MSTRASTTVSVRVVREVFRARHARACDDGDKNENNVCILCVFRGFWWNGMVAVALCIVYCASPSPRVVYLAFASEMLPRRDIPDRSSASSQPTPEHGFGGMSPSKSRRSRMTSRSLSEMSAL